MKRPSHDDGGSNSSPDEKLEAFFSGFLSRHPRLPIVLAAALVVLVVVAILVAKFSGGSH